MNVDFRHCCSFDQLSQRLQVKALNNLNIFSSTMDSISDSKLNEQIIEQQNQIILEISNTQPLIGHLLSPLILLPEYENTASIGFVPGIKYLSTKYLIRKVRGDGNCFYRSFLFSYLEKLLINYNNDSNNTTKQQAIIEHERIITRIKSCKDELIRLGYSEVAFECFYDVSDHVCINVYIFVRNCILYYNNMDSFLIILNGLSFMFKCVRLHKPTHSCVYLIIYETQYSYIYI